MVQPAELLSRERRWLDAEQMVKAAEVVRERGPGGFAGLDRESADALSALLDTLAEDWREPRRHRGCGSTRPARRSASCTPRSGSRLHSSPGPLPAGYESPVRRRNVTDESL